MKIPAGTEIQSVKLRVKNLERSLDFYSGLLGFKEIERINSNSYLSATGEHPYRIGLTEVIHIKERLRPSAGLYHFAVRYPNRKELARIFMNLFNNKIKFEGFSDHIVSEAIYLSDPEGNGVELYADKPREKWKITNGEVEMATKPLDLNSLTKELENRNYDNDEYGIHPETDIGHIHLRVSDLRKAEKFYHGILGFDITQRSYSAALFFAAGGYHHHIGTNVWGSLNGEPAPEDETGLESFTIHIPEKRYVEEIIQRLKDSNLQFEESEYLNVRDFDNIKIKILS